MKFIKIRVLFLSLIGALFALLFLATFPKLTSVSADEEVQILVSNFKKGALIPIASTGEPVVNITTYKGSGNADLNLYQASDDVVFKNLLRDKDSKQINKNIDVSTLAKIASQTINLIPNNQQNKITLPLSSSGIWVLRLTFSGLNFDYILIRSEHGVLVKNADQKLLFWAQNYKSKRSTTSGSLKLYSMLNTQTELAEASFNEQGIAQTPLLPDADIGVAKFGSDEVVFPINLHTLNSSYNFRPFKEQKLKPTYFIFTDRPIYKPGDTVYFKAVLREDDDAFYTIPKGQAKVKVIKDYADTPLTTQDFPISADGSVFGEYKISPDAPVGYYEIEVDLANQDANTYGNRASFDVQYYRKPEYQVFLSTDKLELIQTDKSSAKVSAEYFFNQPVAQKAIKYAIHSYNFAEFEYADVQQFAIQPGFIYSSGGGGNLVTKGDVILDKKGQANINFTAKIPPGGNKYSDPNYEPPIGHNQVFSINALLDDGSGNPSYASKNILVYAGEFDIFRTDQKPSAKVGDKINLSLKLVTHFKADVGNINITSDVHRVNWIPYQDPNQKYTQYKKEEEVLPTISAVSGNDGNASFSITAQKPGYYTFKTTANDKRGNLVKKTFSVYVTSDSDYYSFTGMQSPITVSSDKDKYSPSETAHLTVFSKIADTDVLLSFERGRVRRYQVVHLSGTSAKVDAPLSDENIPNIAAEISSFLDNSYKPARLI